MICENKMLSKNEIKLEMENIAELNTSENINDECAVQGKIENSTKKIPSAAVNMTIENTLNHSDISDEGRLVIADFSENDIDMNPNAKNEDTVTKNTVKTYETITTNIRQLDESISQQLNITSSTMNENSSDSRFSIESDDSLPIQAEVVMSDGDNEENEVYLGPPMNYLPNGKKMSIQSKGKDTFVEYPSTSHKLKEMCGLPTSQLDMLSLPPYAPTVDPPSWLKCTIPTKGYACDSCEDRFNIENSLIEHKERRSILITFSCNTCHEEFKFYNRCAFQGHIKQHLLKGDLVNKEKAIVQPLPLEQMKLLQPIKICKYKQDPGKSNVKRNIEGSISTDDTSNSNLNAEHSSITMINEQAVQCYMCKEKFEDTQQLIQHLKTDQPWSIEKIECKKCRLVLPSLCSGKAHILIHSSSTNEVSICPECGNQSANQREFVRHLNDCGHQFRKSGILCPVCKICFFHFVDDFLSHWINEHCSKYYQCFLCGDKLDVPGFHNCKPQFSKFSNRNMSNVFTTILNCPVCSHIYSNNKDDRDLRIEVKTHLSAQHASIVSRVHYVFKSKFCCNAFKTKGMLNIHHEKDHRKNNSFHSKNCSFFDEVQIYLQKYFDGVQQRNSFVMLDLPEETCAESNPLQSLVEPVSNLVTNMSDNCPKMKNSQKMHAEPLQYDMLKPVHCYQCGYVYSSMKEFRRHSKICKQAVVSLSCDACNKTVSKEVFPQHCISHIKEDLYVCIFCCGRQFKSLLHLKTHFEMHVNGQFIYPATCIFCDFVMTDIASALDHVNNKHEINSLSLLHQCNNCGRKFYSARGLLVHLTKCQSVVNVNSHNMPCKTCNLCKRSINAEIFSKHIIHHFEEGVLICCICDGLHFESRVSLLHHLEDHSLTLDFPYECPICTFTMNDRISCLQHLKDEHGFNNVKCPDCDMSYNYWFKYQRHVSIVHKECTFAKRRYICWMCKAYDHVRKESVLNHIRTVHNLTFEDVNEQVNIRTRGFGTLPSASFMPIKIIGKKETTPKKGVKSKTTQKPYTAKERYCVPVIDNDKNIVIKQEIPNEVYASHELCTTDKIIVHADSQTLHEIDNKRKKQSRLTNYNKEYSILEKSPCKNSSEYHSKLTSPLGKIKQKKGTCPKKASPYKGVKVKFVYKHKDKKLSNRTKVVVKRMKEECDSFLPSKKQKKPDPPIIKFKCKECKYITDKKSKFDIHVASHNKDQKAMEGFYCDECEESFVVKLSLVRHKFFVHRIKQSNHRNQVKKPQSNGKAKRSRSVDEPSKVCSNKSKKRRLSELRTSERKRFTCNVCKENFPTSSSLHSHLRTHGMSFLKMGHKRRSTMDETS